MKKVYPLITLLLTILAITSPTLMTTAMTSCSRFIPPQRQNPNSWVNMKLSQNINQTIQQQLKVTKRRQSTEKRENGFTLPSLSKDLFSVTNSSTAISACVMIPSRFLLVEHK